MKATDIIKVLIVSVSCYFITACTDDDKVGVLPDITPIVMESEGGERVIDVGYENFIITHIVNKTGGNNTYIFGEIYSPDGNLIRENVPLSLEGTGRIESVWSDQGFRIVRDELSRLKVTVMEKSRPEEFNFSIVIKSGDETKEINIQQKESQGYTFDKIEYSLKPDDKDLLYTVKGTTYQLNISSQEFKFSPFGGIDIIKRQYFGSDEPNAFVWTQDAPPAVEIPRDIYDGKIYYDSEKGVYDTRIVTKPHDYEGVEETILIPEGGVEFYVDLEFHYRTVSYSLTLINNRTKEPKVIEGKWIETAPTGKYTIVKTE